MEFTQTIERLAQIKNLSSLELESKENQAFARVTIDHFLLGLEQGQIRSAQKDANGVWKANSLVKEGILTCFRVGQLKEYGQAPWAFIDKDTIPTQSFELQQRIRIVPGGSSVRRGAHLGKSVTMMPPSYVNIGAFVDEETMIDSHALVGSCAQIGKRVHLSAAAQIGGVLEPVGATPVIVEDDVFIGGNCGLYEGTIVRARAVLAAGVVITRSTLVYDLVHERLLKSEDGEALEIPEGAVVVPGSRPAKGDFGRKHGLNMSCMIIVKYRDAKTDAKAMLESALR